MSSTLNEAELNVLFQYANSLCAERADALDLLQGSIEAYLRACSSEQVIENKLAYVRKIIRHRYIDRFRHEQRFEHESYEEASVYDISLESLEEQCINASELDFLWAYLEVADKDILFHWAVLGHTTKEIAALLDMAPGTILSRIHRLRKRLQAVRESALLSTSTQSEPSRGRS